MQATMRHPGKPRKGTTLRAFTSTVACLVGLTCLAETAEPASKFVLEGYGDVLYSHYNYGPDQKSGPNGAPPDDRAIVDLAFFVMEMTYWFQSNLYVEAEIEYEHGGTGAALELEYEEFGEFETEVEKGGEVRLEQLHVTYEYRPWLNLRAGRLLAAVGLHSTNHRPTQYFTTVRSETEVSLIPTTWDETGLQVAGRFRRFDYRLQLINGLDSTGFSSKFWAVGGHQKKFEQVRATDMATVTRVDLHLLDDLMFGGSFYYGNTTGNRPKPDMKGIDGHLSILDLHAVLDQGPWRGRAMFLSGTLENADIISAKNNRLSNNLQVPRTPVAKGARGWYAEAGFDVVSLWNGGALYQLYPFARYEQFDSMYEVDASVFDEPRFERVVTTVGVNYFPHPEVVLKLDYSHRTFGASQFRAEDTISINIGFAADFLRL